MGRGAMVGRGVASSVGVVIPDALVTTAVGVAARAGGVAVGAGAAGLDAVAGLSVAVDAAERSGVEVVSEIGDGADPPHAINSANPKITGVLIRRERFDAMCIWWLTLDRRPT
ncbi:MAG: hypothetical protein HOC77_04540 [Chloroflexi bacterium]|nr:hypothetical protein [Chloroflexota bacterium]MBT4514346.1 hypothetical protein [Chloroflexota bacterium]MBT5319693.1 hypothetical protein [Chloroflexota bacterium]MBT6682753.1 hypothetical protein [Chloroflexota bacterium]